MDLTHPFLLSLCALCVLCGAIYSSTPEVLTQKQGAATLTVTASKAKDGMPQIALSGEIVVTLTVEGPALMEVKEGARIESSGAWQIVKAPAGALTGPAKDGTQRWEQVLHLEPNQPGELKLQVLPIEYRDKGGVWQKAEWKESTVLVVTQVAPTDPPRPPPPIEDLPPREAGPPWLVIGAGTGGALALVSVLAVWLVRRRRRPLPLLPAHTLALRELVRLEREAPATLEESNRFHTRLAGVVRNYLEARFQIPASRQTTEEYSQALSRANHLTDEQFEMLREFLQRCDLPKFAPLCPAPEECAQTLSLARTFVEATREGQLASESAGNTRRLDHDSADAPRMQRAKKAARPHSGNERPL